MAQPGIPGSQFPSEDSLIREVRDLKRMVQQLAAANQLATAGIIAIENGIIVDGSETINGPLAVNGDAEFTGDMKISGTLDLPAGIIGNDALTDPVSIAQTSNGETNFAITTSDVARASTTIAVPAGYTQAHVFAVCNVGAINPTTVSDFLYSSTVIQGVASREVFGYVAPNNGSVAVTTAKSAVVTGLSGGVITIAVNIHAGAAWAAHSSNRAYVEAQAIFLR